MTLKNLYISLFSIIALATTLVISKTQEAEKYVFISNQTNSIAGDSLELKFSSEGNTDASLYCSNSYGSILLNPIVQNNILSFNIPSDISNKSGVLNWKLIAEGSEVNGQIYIKPKAYIKSIESYLGPPSIEAGGTDYTMLVVIPTDDLDNALVDGTDVSIKHQFLSNRTTSDVQTKNGFGYKNIYSERKSGRILINSECLDLNSKEYDVNVMPAIPTNFKIEADRIHNYADGNQIATFKTTIIKDRYDNIVSDGTFVTFFITNKDGYKAKTSGLTINGMATAKMIHPDHEDQWTIKAYVEGMANSDTINLEYKQAIADFDIVFSKDNRTITVGPLKSFMSQRTPDGLEIKLSILKDGLLEEQFIESSLNGLASFHLNTDRFPKGIYNLKLHVAGITKTFTEVRYE
ncbi:hypothetical protein [Winogradskyella sp. PE311]|uniref:hypothetical protein n=1 Tax=Winogradskyella sp. PE311 TaxID=3366943 RepID=UPI00397FFA57